MVPILPCLLGFVCGWVIWNRWLAQAATLLVWGVFLFPFAATSSYGGGSRAAGFWLPVAGLFVLSLLLTELGLRLRDQYQRYLRGRSAKS
ncbi:MAG: hypothetical protein M3R26_01820 [Actinomycetota bacterium]|nr:hypothetical protein [Actinomycetota bacterium]